MNKHILSILALILLFSSCKNKQNPFEISKHHIGLLTDSTLVKDLEKVFIKDSVVKHIGGDEFTGAINDIEIYEKGGTKLLVITPNQSLDSLATISTIQIIDSRFKTNAGINTLSTFKDISNNYKITKIDNLINAIVVSIGEINASFAIDKKELPASLRFDMDLNIEATHIPDNAKIKYFFINWN